MITIKNITTYLESIAPSPYQEGYDNAGLIIGDPNAVVKGVLVCLDAVEGVIEEAIAKGCNLIVAHHPIVFKGLKRLNGKNYVERVVMKAIKHDIAIFAIHTNLDSVYHHGVNAIIAERLGLLNTRILAPKRQLLMKLETFVPTPFTQGVLNALYDAGAGRIGDYENCSFRSEGVGTFKPKGKAQPFIGKLGQDEEVQEHRLEVVFPAHKERDILKALRAAHPYEEVAYYLHRLENEQEEVGSGMIGQIADPMDPLPFLHFLKSKMQTACVRHTQLIEKKIANVAVCGGAGGFLLNDAIRAGADIFVTADYKYHEFFDADGLIIIADIGHFESEQFTIELLYDLIIKKYSEITVFSTNFITNPVRYL